MKVERPDKTGYLARDFQGFRVEMEFPPVPSDIVVSYPLPVG